MPTDSTRTVPDEGANRLLIVELRGGLYGIDSTLVRRNRRGARSGAVTGRAGTRPGSGKSPRPAPHGGRSRAPAHGNTPAATPDGSIVVIAAAERTLGLVVDDVHDVQEPPDCTDRGARSWLALMDS